MPKIPTPTAPRNISLTPSRVQIPSPAPERPTPFGDLAQTAGAVLRVMRERQQEIDEQNAKTRLLNETATLQQDVLQETRESDQDFAALPDRVRERFQGVLQDVLSDVDDPLVRRNVQAFGLRAQAQEVGQAARRGAIEQNNQLELIMKTRLGRLARGAAATGNFDEFFPQGRKTIDETSEHLGLPPEVENDIMRRFESDAVEGRIRTLLGAQQPQVADQVMREHSDKLLPDRRSVLRNLIDSDIRQDLTRWKRAVRQGPDTAAITGKVPQDMLTGVERVCAADPDECARAQNRLEATRRGVELLQQPLPNQRAALAAERRRLRAKGAGATTAEGEAFKILEGFVNITEQKADTPIASTVNAGLVPKDAIPAIDPNASTEDLARAFGVRNNKLAPVAEEHFGLPMDSLSGLSKRELDHLENHLSARQTSSYDVVRILGAARQGLGPDRYQALVGEIELNKPALAVAAETTQEDRALAREIARGHQLKVAGADDAMEFPDKTARREAASDVFGDTGGVEQGRMMAAAEALLVHRADDTGERQIDQDQYEQALQDVSGGVTNVHGFRTFVRPFGMDPDDYRERINRFTPNHLREFGNGMPLVHDGLGNIRPIRLEEIGSALRYRVDPGSGMATLEMTGPDGNLGTVMARVDTGAPEPALVPFVLDMSKAVRNAPEPEAEPQPLPEPEGEVVGNAPLLPTITKTGDPFRRFLEEGFGDVEERAGDPNLVLPVPPTGDPVESLFDTFAQDLFEEPEGAP